MSAEVDDVLDVAHEGGRAAVAGGGASAAVDAPGIAQEGDRAAAAGGGVSAAVDAPGVAREGDRAAAVGGGVSNCLGWIGTLPGGWRVKPLRAIADSIISNVDKFVSDDEIPVRLCNYTDVYNNDFIKPDLDLMRVTASVQEIERFGLLVDDVIITKDSESWEDIGVPALVTETADDIVCGYHLALLRPHKDIIHGAFLFRCLQARPVQAQLELTANGVTRFGLSKSDIRRTAVPVPPLREQRAIADHLGRETARLDALVAAKERLLVLLAEKRRAVVTRAVTRGLDPRVPTRDSGVPWLGAVPAHWQIKRLKHVGQTIIGLTYDPKNIVNDDSGVLVLRASNVQDQKVVISDDSMSVMMNIPEHLRTRAGDILICSRSGSRNLIGKSALIGESFAGCTFGVFMTVFRSVHACEHYMFCVLNSPMFDFQAGSFSTSTINQLTVETLENMKVPLPPRSEQQEISRYLGDETKRIGSLIDKTRETIHLLSERRAALITAAVTGQTGHLAKNNG